MLREVPQAFLLCTWAGGVRDNVIPTDCTAEIAVSSDDAEAVARSLNETLRQIGAEYPHEKTVYLEIGTAPGCAPFAVQNTAALLDALALLPNGVQSVNEALQMPQTSLNLGIFTLREQADEMQVDALIRSGINAEKHALADRLRRGSAWLDVPESHLRRILAMLKTHLRRRS